MITAKYEGKMVSEVMNPNAKPSQSRYSEYSLSPGEFATSSNGRWVLKMFPNGNLEWGFYQLLPPKGANVDFAIAYRRAWHSNTAGNKNNYARFGPMGHRGYNGPYPPVRGPAKLAIYRSKSAVKSFPEKRPGSRVLHLHDDGRLAIESTKGNVVVYVWQPPKRIDTSATFQPNVNTLILNTPGIELDPKGHRTIHNKDNAPMNVFDGKKVERLEANEAAHFSQTGQLSISMLAPPLDELVDLEPSPIYYQGSSQGDVVKESVDVSIQSRYLKTVPASDNYITVGPATVPAFTVAP